MTPLEHDIVRYVNDDAVNDMALVEPYRVGLLLPDIPFSFIYDWIRKLHWLGVVNAIDLVKMGFVIHFMRQWKCFCSYNLDFFRSLHKHHENWLGSIPFCSMIDASQTVEVVVEQIMVIINSLHK